MTALILVATLVLVALAELAARGWIRSRRRYHVWAPGARYDVRLSPDLTPPLEPRVRFDVNADGERGGPVPRSRRGLYRVLVAGGSPVECFLSDQGTSWHGVLERVLATPENLRTLGATRVHVGNIGRSGVSAQDLDFIFERVLPRYELLDAIVIMIGGNDVFHWLEHGAPDPYPPTTVPVRRFFACHPEGQFRWRDVKGWALVESARRLRHRWLRPVEVQPEAGAWIAGARAMRAGAQILHTVPDPSEMLDRFELHLRRLLQRARGRAWRVVLARQPWFEKDYTPDEALHIWHGGTGSPWRQKVSVFYSLDVLNNLMRLMDVRAMEVADELGVEQLDLNACVEPGLAHYQDYVHYTPQGAAVVGRAVAGALVRLPSARPQIAEPALVASAAVP